MEYVDLKQISATSASVKAVLEYLRTHDLQTANDGRQEIDGDNFYCNVFRYQTADSNERIWEAHREYVDVHLVLEGEEIVHQAFLHHADCVEYHADRDYLEINSAPVASRILLRPQQLLVFYPEDAHQTGVKQGQSCAIRKAVFKWAIKSLS